jgi:hypothetical protein
MRRKSVRTYFLEKCANGPKNKDFWPTIKPFLSNKGYKDGNDITLSEDSKLVSDPKQICDIFNNYYVNITSQLGLCEPKDTDSCVKPILDHQACQNVSHVQFTFQPISTEIVAKKLDKLNGKKATGFDGIPPKLLKAAAHKLAPSLASQINLGIAGDTSPVI